MYSSTDSPAQTLRKLYRATRLSFKWWGQRRGINGSAKEQMADAVDAEAASITAGKKLYSEKLESIKQINALKCEIDAFWHGITLPWTEKGVRLLKREQVEEFNQRMETWAERLKFRAGEVQAAREAILDDARERLGSAFNSGDYPLDLSTLFAVEWSFPSIDPPRDLPQEIYEQQKKAVEAKLEEAVTLAEQAFLSELQQLVSALHERLTPDASGQKKVFRDSAVTNLAEFFERFKQLNIGSNEELDRVVTQAQELVSGVLPKELRASEVLRAEVQKGLADLTDKLTPLVVKAPRRKIVMAKKPNSPVAVEPAIAAPVPA
jgi:hypothetical protein